MLKERDYVFRRVNMGIDFALTALSVGVAHVLRNEVIAPYLLPNVFREPAHFSDYSWLAWTMPFVMVAFLARNGYYSSQRVKTFAETCKSILLSAVETALVAMVAAFLLIERRGGVGADFFKGDHVSRGVIFLAPIVLTILIILKTLLVRNFLIALRNRGKNSRSLLLVGSGETLRHFINLIQNHPFWGFQFAGVIDDSGREAKVVEGVPVVGQLGSLWEFLESNAVDEVVFIPARRSLDDLAPYFEGCEEMGIRTRLSLNFFNHTIAKPVLDTFQEVPVVTYSPTRELNSAMLFKYAFDRIAALVLLCATSWLFLLIGVLIKATSRSWSDPVFYGQTRSGLNGRLFKLWKFRSMEIGADKKLDTLLDKNEMGGPVFKIKNDPRVTWVGKLIRKSSLDELPQLWNVLQGEMSLVGPRPPLPAEVAKYDRWQRRRLSMKPGITCLWQVNGRNHLPFETWMKLDLEYIDNWSLFLDFKILFKTIYVVATGYGAM